MGDMIREFLVGIGYRVDRGSEQAATESARRVERAVRAADARTTQAQVQGSARRIVQANRERGVRTRGAATFIAETKRQKDADADRLKAEERAGDKRRKLNDRAIAFTRGLTSVVQGVAAAAVGSAAALAGVAVSSTALVEKMAAGLERIYYASQRTKSSAASLQAFGFAASQLGSSAESAIGAVEALAEKIRSSPGYESMLQSLGVSTRDERGNVREYTEQMAQLGDVLRKMPMHQQKAYAGALGISDDVLAALTSGDFRKQMQRYRDMLSMAGLKPDEAAAKSKAFMNIFREMQSAISIVAVKVQSALVDRFGSALEKFTTWLLTNADRIAGAVIKIGETLAGWVDKAADLFKAFQNLSPATQDMLIKFGALAAALLLFNAGPIGALVAATAALIAFVDPAMIARLGEMWDKFDALCRKITGQDGVTVAFAALAAVLGLKVVGALTKVSALLTGFGGIRLPPWLLGLLGVGVAAGVASSQGILNGPGDSRSVGEGVLRTLDPGLADRVYGPTPGGRAATERDDRTLWQRIAPKVLGGRDAPGATGGGGQFTEGRKPENAGRYRPTYNLSAADLDQRVVNTIAGEVSTRNAEGVDAVINNMLNRVGSKGWGPSGNLLQVARAPGQYAGYRAAGAAESEFVRARIRAIASGGVPDNTGGSNAYRAAWYKGPWYRKNAARGVIIGGNRFAYEGGVANGPYAPYKDPRAGTPQPTAPAAPAEPKPPSFQLNPEWAPKLSGALSRLNETMNKGEGARLRTASAFQAPPLGERSVDNSTSKTVSIKTGDTHMQFSGAGDVKAAAETFGATQGRVHADLLRNLQSAVG